jgi:hypothetical protein
MKKILLSVLIFLLSISFVYADQINDNEFKFTVYIPSGWDRQKTEETSQKDAISYSINRKDSKNALMLLAFKVNAIKELDDLVYTFEKDFTLKIPPRSGDYKSFDNGSYDGKMAVYKDNEFTETIYYYRTKNSDGSNYAYVLRFITPNGSYNYDTETEIKQITDSFKPVN